MGRSETPTAAGNGVWSHAETWIKDHFEAQPEQSRSLCYFVAAWAAFRQYLQDADRSKLRPLTFGSFCNLVQRHFPKMRAIKWKGVDTFVGVSFYKDRIGGHLIFGI